MSCNNFYPCYTAACTDSLTIKANLLANTQYTLNITDKFGSRYTQDVTSASDGGFVIDFTALPDGLLTPYSGYLDIQVYNASKYVVTFSICATAYNGFQLSAFKGTDVNGGVIKGQCSIVPGGNQTEFGYYQLDFNFSTDSYTIQADTHKLSIITSVELLVYSDGAWSSPGFTYDIDPGTQDITLYSDDMTSDFKVILTGVA